MYVNITVKPPNREYYLNRCQALARYLALGHRMPTIIIVSACWDVLKEAFGSDLRVLWWVVLNVTVDRVSDLKYLAWLNWQMYVMLRTREEIGELLFSQFPCADRGAEECAEVEKLSNEL